MIVLYIIMLIAFYILIGYTTFYFHVKYDVKANEHHPSAIEGLVCVAMFWPLTLVAILLYWIYAWTIEGTGTKIYNSIVDKHENEN